MIEIPIPVRADLDRGIRKTYLDTVFATEDDKAHRIDVALYRGNEPITLPSGASVSAYFIRYSDNGTLPLTGVFSGNVASVTLTKACYNKSGAFALIIKVVENGVTSTVFYGEGSMFVSRTDTLIDDENIIPSLDELLAMVAVMENATEEAATATASASTAAAAANNAAQRANTEADAAQGWADATATVETLEAGEDADVTLSTAASGAKVLGFSIPRGESGVYVGNEEPTDPTVQVWIDPDGEADEMPDGVSTEDLQAAVNAYLDAHPVTSGATAQQAAQIQKNKEAIQELQQNGTGGGLTAEQVNALDGMFKAAAYTRADISAVYAAFKAAFGIAGGDDPDAPEKTLISISVTYTGGDVYAGALLSDLSGITVTAQYSDRTSKIVTGYNLSGEILEGQNTITVTYNGMIDTFIVTGLPHEEETDGNDPPFDTATWTSGLRIVSGGTEYTGHANYETCSYIDVSGIEAFTISRSDDVSGNVNFLCCFYDGEQAYMSATDATYINANSTTYPTSATVNVPDGAKYCRICGTKLSGVAFNELVKITV